MKRDIVVFHTDDIKTGSGTELYGTPIREVNILDVEVREELDCIQRVSLGKDTQSVPIELLPGETLVNNLIRRVTTVEATEREN